MSARSASRLPMAAARSINRRPEQTVSSDLSKFHALAGTESRHFYFAKNGDISISRWQARHND